MTNEEVEEQLAALEQQVEQLAHRLLLLEKLMQVERENTRLKEYIVLHEGSLQGVYE